MIHQREKYEKGLGEEVVGGIYLVYGPWDGLSQQVTPSVLPRDYARYAELTL